MLLYSLWPEKSGAQHSTAFLTQSFILWHCQSGAISSGYLSTVHFQAVGDSTQCLRTLLLCNTFPQLYETKVIEQNRAEQREERKKKQAAWTWENAPLGGSEMLMCLVFGLAGIICQQLSLHNVDGINSCQTAATVCSYRTLWRPHSQHKPSYDLLIFVFLLLRGYSPNHPPTCTSYWDVFPLVPEEKLSVYIQFSRWASWSIEF